MTKEIRQMLSFLERNGYWLDQSITGYYRLFRGLRYNQSESDLIYDDPASDDVYDYDSAIYTFYCIVTGEYE